MTWQQQIWLIVVLSLILATPLALAEVTILNDDRATLELTITSKFSLEAKTSSAHVSSSEAELSWFPRETYNQDVEEIDTNPEADEHDEYYLFEWDNPAFGSHNIIVTTLLSTNNDITPISTKEQFPLPRIDADLLIYTQASKMIDSNTQIRGLAGNLAASKDNQYEVVFALADWVTTNIDYELSSITAEANYPSSWVLEQGYGVCDEMTNLFISLNRALGIPSRFVSGLAYTNMEELPTNWGAHGWAEVWFP
ncbi:transglutaminase domain-containing protein, partial [Candidatus Woesearchaeota archaeon]|nr:transglutaminase domain-containing protein [Candidatus Woesearchaeota archaeon]